MNDNFELPPRSRSGTGATRLAAVAVALVGLVAGVLVAPGPAQAQTAPVIDRVEIRANRTILVEWQPVEGVVDYQLAYRADGDWTPILTQSVDGDRTDPISRVINPSDWNPTVGAAYELAVRAGTEGDDYSTPAPVEIQPEWPRPTQTSAGGSSITISWPAVAAAEPFVAYQVFLGRPHDPIADCLAADITDRATTSIVLSALPAGCGGGGLGSTDYAVGLRVVTSQMPFVSGAIASASAAVSGRPAPAEQYRTGQVGGRSEIVDNATGQAAVWNQVNVRRGDGDIYTQSRADLNAIKARGFDSLRIVMTWSRFEPEPGHYDPVSFHALDQVLGYAADADLNVVLDPLHLAGGPEWGIPDWAWERTTGGEYSSTAVLDALKENSYDFLAYVTNRYHRTDPIVAIDVVNEPREPRYDQLGSNNDRLMELYHDMIAVIRDIDPDKPLILQPYYGSATITANQLSAVADGTWFDPSPDPADYTNLIWSLHDYYAGREGRATDDGYDRDGYGLRGRAFDGTRYRTDSWDGTGCYPSGYAAWACTNDTRRDLVLRPSMTNHVLAHLDVADQAGMPLYIGEYGIPHPGGRYAGWSGGDLFMSDKIKIYDELGVSRAQWAWSSEVDYTYGLYSMSSNTWRSWTDYVVGDAIAPETSIAGDVDCDGDKTMFDALAGAQYLAGRRADRGGCDNPGIAGDVLASSIEHTGDTTTDHRDVEALLRCLIGAC